MLTTTKLLNTKIIKNKKLYWSSKSSFILIDNSDCDVEIKKSYWDNNSCNETQIMLFIWKDSNDLKFEEKYPIKNNYILYIKYFIYNHDQEKRLIVTFKNQVLDTYRTFLMTTIGPKEYNQLLLYLAMLQENCNISMIKLKDFIISSAIYAINNQ